MAPPAKEILSWEDLVRSGRLSRAQDREDPAAPHLRKVRVKHLVAQQTAYTLRIRMPCSRTDGCNGCVIAQDMSVDRGSTRTGLVLVWNERRHQCALLVERLNPPARPSTSAAQAIDPPGTVTPVGTPVPQTVTARQAAVADTRAVRTEAEGLRLHLSSRNSNGYWGVHRQGGRFVAQQWLGGKNVCLGVFGTAVEAAVAYARAVGEYQPPAVATEAEGLRLHLSSSSSSGYKGVGKLHSGRYQAHRTVDGRVDYLGLFGTAVEAAVAYARAVGEAQPAGAARGALRPGGVASQAVAAAVAAAELYTRAVAEESAAAAAAEAGQPSTAHTRHSSTGASCAASSVALPKATASSAASSSADRAAAARAAVAPEGGRQKRTLPVLDVGTAVRVRWLASKPETARRNLMGANRWYMGAVRAYDDADGTYSIDYDDGASEEGVAPQHVQVLEEEADDEDDVATGAESESGEGEAQAVAKMEGAGESISMATATTPRRAEKRPLEAAKATPPKRRSSEISAVPSPLSPSSSARAPPTAYGASSAAASASSAGISPSSRLFKLLPDGRTIHREPPLPTGGIAAVAEALARIGLQAYAAAFDAEG